jgi:hypothetical protein
MCARKERARENRESARDISISRRKGSFHIFLLAIRSHSTVLRENSTIVQVFPEKRQPRKSILLTLCVCCVCERREDQEKFVEKKLCEVYHNFIIANDDYKSGILEPTPISRHQKAIYRVSTNDHFEGKN